MSPIQKCLLLILTGLWCMCVGCIKKTNESLSTNKKLAPKKMSDVRVADSDDKTDSSKSENKMDPIYKKLKSARLTHAEYQSIRRTILESVKKDSEQKKILAEQMRHESDSNIKIFLLQIIGDTRDGFYEADVRDVINTETDVRILQTAATVLGKLETLTNVAVLFSLLSHESSNVRLGAVWGLKNVSPSPQVVEELLNVIDDRDPVQCWWPSPAAGGYTVGKEAADAIDEITKTPFKGNRELIQKWLARDRCR